MEWDSPVGLDIYNSTIYIASRALAKSQAMGIGMLMLALYNASIIELVDSICRVVRTCNIC